MFKNAIVRIPCSQVTEGITGNPGLGKPDYKLALKQHEAYIEALKKTGVSVKILPPSEAFPDSCFVEDDAVLTSKCAIITNPGAESRKGEIEAMIPVIKEFYPEEKIEYIKAPGTLEGGDVMMVGDHFYVGRSGRTNEEGIRQFIGILQKYGLTGSEVSLEEVLHLKTGVNYLEDNNMLVSGEFIEKEEFKKYNKHIVAETEAYGANSVWMNGYVLVPKGYPGVEKTVRDLGYEVIIVDTSEFRKIDGGLSCLSLRF